MNYDQYKNQLNYPNTADFTTTYWYRSGKVVAKRGPDGDTVFLDGPSRQLDDCVKEKVVAETELKAARAAYGAETARLTQLFRDDLAEELGITDHPKRDLLLSKAWDMGHSAGFSEVANYAEDLVDLIK